MDDFIDKNRKRGIRIALNNVRKHRMNDKMGNKRYWWDFCCWAESSRKASDCDCCVNRRYWKKGAAAMDYELKSFNS